MAIKFDIVTLCELIETRECLWNKRIDAYKNKIMREKAWEEIFQNLDDEYEEKTIQQRKETGK